MNKTILICRFSILFYLFGIHYASAKQIFTKNQIVATIPEEKDSHNSMDLIWGITQYTCNQHEIFISVHKENLNREFSDAQHIACIYRKIGEEYELLKKIHTMGYFEEPNCFWIERKQLIQITEIQYGTGHIRTEHIFRPLCSGDIQKVEFIPAPLFYKKHLNEAEGIWKGEINKFSKDGLFFTFYIWKEGDPNCCPSAGKVTGTYKIEKTKGDSLKISAKEFKREPYDHYQ